MNWVIGVDEAGRGALAGPVCVGAVLYPEDFEWQELFSLVQKRGEVRVRDSKQLSQQQREILFEAIEKNGRLKHAAALVDAGTIDSIGIVNAAHEAVAIAIRNLNISSAKARVLLDAGLKAPSSWVQEAFVRGDASIPAIAFASIVAKVTRDRHMEDVSEKYESYGFAQHKGYGTAAHIKAVNRLGACEIHRSTFLSFVR